MFYNKVILSGIICSDINMRYTKTEMPIARFDLLVDGKKKPAIIQIVAKRYLAEYVCCNFKEGSNILAEGYLQSKTTSDTTNTRRAVIEMVAEKINFAVEPNHVPYKLVGENK